MISLRLNLTIKSNKRKEMRIPNRYLFLFLGCRILYSNITIFLTLRHDSSYKCEIYLAGVSRFCNVSLVLFSSNVTWLSQFPVYPIVTRVATLKSHLRLTMKPNAIRKAPLSRGCLHHWSALKFSEVQYLTVNANRCIMHEYADTRASIRRIQGRRRWRSRCRTYCRWTFVDDTCSPPAQRDLTHGDLGTTGTVVRTYACL